ncbi:MAG: hypothetical protein RBJ76_13430 [Stenomitos frigidus ULC029]
MKTTPNYRVVVIGTNAEALKELAKLCNLSSPTAAANMALSQILPKLLEQARQVQKGIVSVTPFEAVTPAPTPAPTLPSTPAPAPQTSGISQRDALRQALGAPRVEP